MLRAEPRARLFLLVSAQSAIGNGAAIPALMVLAYDRRHSPWAITAVLLAYLLPPGVLGPFAGAAVDRFSRRRCAVAADWVRALAFGGIALLPGFGATVALAFVAGAGTALFSPAVLAALPSLADEERVPALISAYGGLGDAGRMAGPALAALGFALIGAEGVLAVNAATFVISALALMLLPFGAALPGAHAGGGREFFREVAEGLRGPMRIPLIRAIVLGSTMVILFAAMISPAELPLARAYGGGASALGLLLAVFGVGVVAGSLSGARS